MNASAVRLAKAVRVPGVSLIAYCLCRRNKKKKSAGSVDTTGMDQERMTFCVLHRTIDAETHNIPPGAYR